MRPRQGEGLRWIVDPLDGTVNFLFGVPQWCVSVAVHDDEGGLAGVIFDPLRGELFAAARGQGAPTLNGAAVRASERDELACALVATGFAYDAGVRAVAGAGRQQAVAAGPRRAPDGKRGARPRVDGRGAL